MAEHGYIRYTRGCRCEVCRAAKADYMRARRAEARGQAQVHTFWAKQGGAWGDGAIRHVANVANHGTRFAYEERGCRCLECSRARATSDARVYANRKKRSK